MRRWRPDSDPVHELGRSAGRDLPQGPGPAPASGKLVAARPGRQSRWPLPAELGRSGVAASRSACVRVPTWSSMIIKVSSWSAADKRIQTAAGVTRVGSTPTCEAIGCRGRLRVRDAPPHGRPGPAERSRSASCPRGDAHTPGSVVRVLGQPPGSAAGRRTGSHRRRL